MTMMKRILALMLILAVTAGALYPAAAEELSGPVFEETEEFDPGELSVLYSEETEEEVTGDEATVSEIMDRGDPKWADSEPVSVRTKTSEEAADGQDRSIVDFQNEQAERWQKEGNLLRASAASVLTLTELRNKYPAGKYWNHADNPGSSKEQNNDNGWTDVPCPENHTDLIHTEMQTCNAWWPGDWMLGVQCYGYADKLGYDATGTDPETWEKRAYAGALDNLKPGDIVRYLNDKHSIFVIGVEGENVYYTECNEGGTCVIRWDKKTTKSELKESFTYLRVCPVTLSGQQEYCRCSVDIAGTYTCAGYNLPVFGGHSFSGEPVVWIPAGATFEVSRGCGEIAHVTYNGIEGYTYLSYMTKLEGPVMDANWIWMSLTVPDSATERLCIYLSGTLPKKYHLSTYMRGGLACRLEFVQWESSYVAAFDVTATGAGDGVICVDLIDSATGKKIASHEIPVRTKLGRTFLEASESSVSIDGRVSDSRTITLTASGYLPGSFTFKLIRFTQNIFRVSWPGEWNGYSHDLTITGKRAGEGTLIFGVVCNDVVRATAAVELTVTGADAVIVSGLTEVNLNIPDVRERTFTLTLDGILPASYSMSMPEISGTGFSMRYVDGKFYNLDGKTAIDVAVSGTAAGSGTIRLKVIDYATKETVSVFEWPVTVWNRALKEAGTVLPKGTVRILDEAFRGTASGIVELPEGVTYIGRKAFADCRYLAEILIPAAAETIEEDAFDGAWQLTVFGSADSAAETYALAHGFDFVPVK